VKKMIISVFMAISIALSLPAMAMAHPSSLTADTKSTYTGLITVRKPDSSSTATMKSTYSVTGVGTEGTSVCFYTYDGEKYVADKDSSGNPQSITIGASGVFYKQISLSDGLNKICVRAEKNGEVQVVYLSINMIKNDVVKEMDTFSTDFGLKYNGWLN